ncbi:DinB family protein [Cyclobacterium xiamenense]|jgi:hypothetical protein|uniref:DinB family protein n=1 Tax=Cyclobacterium xiamenense TaxID=1297121 RepID=UPI0035CF25D7
MNDKADAWQMELTRITYTVDKLMHDYDLTTLNRKPDPKTWSPMQVLQHLILVNRSYFPTFDQLIAKQYKAPLLGKISFYGRKLGELILAANKKPARIKTFGPWEPTDTLHNNELLQAFVDTQHRLSAYVQELEPFFGRGLMIASPANRWLVYPLDTAIDIIIAHEKRHCKQLKSLLAAE